MIRTKVETCREICSDFMQIKRSKTKRSTWYFNIIYPLMPRLIAWFNKTKFLQDHFNFILHFDWKFYFSLKSFLSWTCRLRAALMLFFPLLLVSDSLLLRESLATATVDGKLLIEPVLKTLISEWWCFSQFLLCSRLNPEALLPWGYWSLIDTCYPP